VSSNSRLKTVAAICAKLSKSRFEMRFHACDSSSSAFASLRSATIIDSQSVKTAEAGDPRRCDAGKKVNGRKPTVTAAWPRS
jgi:hypothetical protein